MMLSEINTRIETAILLNSQEVGSGYRQSKTTAILRTSENKLAIDSFLMGSPGFQGGSANDIRKDRTNEQKDPKDNTEKGKKEKEKEKKS